MEKSEGWQPHTGALEERIELLEGAVAALVRFISFKSDVIWGDDMERFLKTLDETKLAGDKFEG